jgi:predicted transcriptional regulator
MINKIIITETQFNRLFKPLLKESHFNTVLSNVLEDLDKNYEKATAVVKDYRDYHEKPRFKVKVDDSLITAKDLLEYLKYKYHEVCGEDFLIQVIDDWYHSKIDGGHLSKNITLK